MQIPHSALADETLQNLVEEFVTREGTDYGSTTYSLADKVKHVLRQLEKGSAVIVYDPHSATCHIMTKDDLPPESSTDVEQYADE
jgi:uncharacterized protein YheU (UPF0270 family)